MLIAAGAIPDGGNTLSEPRFEAVRQALVDDGVAPQIIARAPMPRPKLAAVDGGLSGGDERVEIRLLASAP